MRNLKLLFALALFAIIVSCSKDNEPTPEVIVPEVKLDPPKGKFVITGATNTARETAFIFDIRDKNAPKRLAYFFSNGKFKLTNTVALGTGLEPSDANWPTAWRNIKLIPSNGISLLNMDTKLETYKYFPAGFITAAKTEDFYPFPAATVWKNHDKVNGGVNFIEAYGTTTNKTMGFYFDFATGEYLYVSDEYSTAPNYYTGYKISDLLKKSNGNVDTDPIDWSKSDLVFCFNNTYENKEVTQFVFIDLDNNTYASFVRNKKDDPIKGADAGRQTLLTTKWEPILNLFETWPIK
jgi:hypothetical protein